MRSRKSTKRRIWPIVVALLLVAVVVIAGIDHKLRSETATPLATPTYPATVQDPDVPSDVSSDAPSSESSSAASSGGGSLLALGKSFSATDPFASRAGDTRMHSVTITITADGAAYAGYRYRDGKRSDVRIVDRRFSITRSVRGPLPIVQIGVQVMSNSTWATCSIAIDGTTTNSQTVRGVNHVGVCTS